MKKSLLLTFATCLVALVTFSAFSDSMTAEQKKQQQNIADLLTEKLDAFRIAKEQECQERAIAAAVVKADEMTAKGTNKKVTRKPVKKKPTYNTTPKGTTTAPPPPPPPPAAPKTAKEVQEAQKEAASNATNSGRKTDAAAKKAIEDAQKEIQAAKQAAQEAQKEAAKKATNSGRRKSGGN